MPNSRAKQPMKYDGFVRAGTFVLISYLLLSLGRSLYKNYQFNNQLDDVRTSISQLKVQNQELASLAEFYRSQAFLERQARAKLNLKFPDEQVVIVPDDPKPPTDDTVSSDSATTSGSQSQTANNPTESPNDNDSNFVKWWHWFFE